MIFDSDMPEQEKYLPLSRVLEIIDAMPNLDLTGGIKLISPYDLKRKLEELEDAPTS